MTRRIASVSLDLDNKWSYLKTHGNDAWKEFPSYFDLVVPRILSFMEEREVKITVFVVGQDAALEKNRASLASIATAGHEIANHSFHHEPWLHLYDADELEQEFIRSEAAIRDATGQQTIGFRGPGFSLSDDVLVMLSRRNYLYDGTVFPTFLGPVARAYYFFKSRLSREERKQRKALFGRLSDGFRPLKPFEWQMENNELIEIPVTTMPVFKLPIHLSYIFFLASYSRLLARYYFWQSITMCRMFGVEPSLLLHPLDFLGRDDDEDLAFFPGMNLTSTQKIEIVANVFRTLSKHHRLVTMREHAEMARERNLAKRSPTIVRPATG